MGCVSAMRVSTKSMEKASVAMRMNVPTDFQIIVTSMRIVQTRKVATLASAEMDIKTSAPKMSRGEIVHR